MAKTRTRITTGGGRVTAGQAQALIDYLPDDAPALPLPLPPDDAPLPPDDALADTPELAWLAPDWDGVYAPAPELADTPDDAPELADTPDDAPELADTPEFPPDAPDGAQDALGCAGVGKDAEMPIGGNDAPPAPPLPRQRDLPEFGVCLTRGCGRRSVRAGRCQYCGDWEWQRIWGGVSSETGRPHTAKQGAGPPER